MSSKQTALEVLRTIYGFKPVESLKPTSGRVEAWAQILLPAMKPKSGREAALGWLQLNNGYPEPADINQAWMRINRGDQTNDLGDWKPSMFPWDVEICIGSSPSAYLMVCRKWSEGRRYGAERGPVMRAIIGLVHSTAAAGKFADFGTQGLYTPELQQQLQFLTRDYQDWPPSHVLARFLKPENQLEISTEWNQK